MSISNYEKTSTLPRTTRIISRFSKEAPALILLLRGNIILFKKIITSFSLTGAILTPTRFQSAKSNVMRVNWKPNGTGNDRGFRVNRVNRISHNL